MQNGKGHAKWERPYEVGSSCKVEKVMQNGEVHAKRVQWLAACVVFLLNNMTCYKSNAAILYGSYLCLVIL